ncbi:hypothetical protein NQ036_03970 [Brevibacterium sp. 91QC2O2]|uniref:hypothetical protein n=1 Tax=Brevibacterium sp. 91QC2O2 TaxID=2968458 RepID=UPI00211BCC42|nr:hypothetical protein [Brevibacterium sp. 91QC2O2]MCQ9367405.1 hypothetical protein [Brevibacterium sp. 91QC2O2]
MESLLETLQTYTESLPDWLHWVVVLVMGAVPYVGSHFAALLGTLAGVSNPVTLASAFGGNAAALLATAAVADRARRHMRRIGRTLPIRRRKSKLERRVRRAIDRYGVAGFALLGQVVIPSQLSTAAMIALGVNRRKVIAWQLAGSALWACVATALTDWGLDTLVR